MPIVYETGTTFKDSEKILKIVKTFYKKVMDGADHLVLKSRIQPAFSIKTFDSGGGGIYRGH